jgi:hypothetical protein
MQARPLLSRSKIREICGRFFFFANLWLVLSSLQPVADFLVETILRSVAISARCFLVQRFCCSALSDFS